MKLAYVLVCILMITACEGNKSTPPQADAVAPAPVPAPPPSQKDDDALNDGLPSEPSDLGPSPEETKFVQAARDYITALNLPTSAHFNDGTTDSQKAQHFVGIRCSLLLGKLRAAPKSFTNLYDEEKLGDVCHGRNIRLIPGQAVSSDQTFGFFAPDTSSIEISIRPDFTVKAYRTTDSSSSVLGHDRLSEHVVALEGDRRVESDRSDDGSSLQITDRAGRFSYSERKTSMSQSRDGSTFKTLLAHGLRNNRSLSVTETTSQPAPGFLGMSHDLRVQCQVAMLNADGTTYFESRESSFCFPQGYALFQ